MRPGAAQPVVQGLVYGEPDRRTRDVEHSGPTPGGSSCHATGGRPATGGISSLSVKAQCKAKRIELIEEAKMKLARLRATTTVRPCSTHDSHNCSKPSRHIAAAAVAAAAASFALLVVRVFIIIQLMG